MKPTNEVRETVASALEAALAGALEAGDWRAVASVGKTWAGLAGAAERDEKAADADPLPKDPRERLSRMRSVRSALDDAIDSTIREIGFDPDAP